MIEFKIISTVDRSQIASYQHFGAELSLGKTEGDMLIDDPQLANLQLRVRVGAGQTTLENADPSVEVRLNGRAIDGETPMKEKDSVSVGKTSIQFLRLDLNPMPVPDPIEYRNAAGRFTPESKEQAVLDALEHLERQSDESVIAATSVPRPGTNPAIPSVPKPPLPGRMPPVPPPFPKKS